MLLGPGLPSPATLLFNCPTRSIMPIVNSILISTDNDDEYHKVLVKNKKNDKKYDIARNYTLLPIRSTVVVKREDSDRWTHGTILGKGDYNHNNQSYIIHVIKTGKTLSRNSKHVKVTPITADQYL